MLKFSLKEQSVKLAKFNPRTEFHGDKHQPACDLKIEAKLPNSCLATFSETLKSFLYYLDKAKLEDSGDLADKANQADPNFAPHTRMPFLKMPLKWGEEMAGAKFTIHYGIDAKSDLVLDESKIGGFEIDAQDGGTVELTFTVSSKVDATQSGRLHEMQQSDIRISIQPAAEPQADGLGGGTE